MPLTERNTNIPVPSSTNEPPSQKTLQSQSRLPRRVATPNTATPTLPWKCHVADRVASAERNAGEAQVMSGQKLGDVTIRPIHKKSSLPVIDKPLPKEKALPSRPIAQLSNSLSPSKDSRSLIDAEEQPLHIMSVDGDKRDWPTLKPESSGSGGTFLRYKSQTSKRDSSAESTGSRRNDKGTSTDRSSHAPTETATPSTESLTQDDDTDSTNFGQHTSSHLADVAVKSATKASQNSAIPQASDNGIPRLSASSYVSARERSSSVNLSRQTSLDVTKTRNSMRSSMQVRRRPSDGPAETSCPARQSSLRARISRGSLVGPSSTSRFVAFTEFTRADAASPASMDSHQHSPSPASFSQPRPGSISVTSPKMKTASRIPIRDSKKATGVDVRKQGLSKPTPTNLTGPSFGSRQLVSPGALNILDQGIKRRQLQRTPTSESANDSQLDRPTTAESDATTAATPSLTYSLGSSPEFPGVPATSAAGTQDLTSLDPPKSEWESPTFCDSTFSDWAENNFEERTADIFDSHPRTLSRRPPPTSPFTGPLQTIPSEAALVESAGDDEAYQQVTRTLSQLEGKGSPPKFDVDNKELLQMFGHLKKGFEKHGHDSNLLVENAAAAENDLKMRGSGSSVAAAKEAIAKEANGTKETRTSNTIEGTKTVEENHNETSRWSSTTPSDKALSPRSERKDAGAIDTAAGRSVPARLLRDCQSFGSTKIWREPTRPSASIGYPSRIPGRPNVTAEQSPDGGASIASIPQRRSSRTLGGKRKPGSVRAALEGIQAAKTPFPRTTRSAASKKTSKPSKAPTPTTRTFSIPGSSNSQRGRIPSAHKTRVKSAATDVPKTPRPRSRSRIVLDKINGLFSGKRERRSSIIPPVPRIEERNGPTNGVEVSAEGSPTVKPPRSPLLPKLPSLSPSLMALRNSSPSRTDDTTLVDSITLSDDSQSVQVLSEHLVGKALRETNTHRKERLLNFAKVLNDSLISVREANIAAETAQHAAKHAQMSYEMTQESLAMVQRLATSVARGVAHNRR